MFKSSSIARTIAISALFAGYAQEVNAEGAVVGGGVEGAAPAAPAAPLTRDEKYAKTISTLKARIEADTAKLAEVEQERETAARLSGVTTNSVVTAKLGRAETTREVLARVLGVQELENGSRRFKILFGEGLDTDTAIIQESQIVKVEG